MIPPATDLVEISLRVDGEVAEAICELFERYGGGAVVESRLRTKPEDGPDLPEPEHWVRTYLDAGDSEARAKVEVGLWHLGQIHPLPEPIVRHLASADWAEAWKEHYSPLRIGRHFLIVPSWLDALPEPGDRLIRLDPGMAFGTGLHPTTRLCLAALEELVRPGMTVLDVGTGSGILAIGAARLGATRLVGTDIDPRAVTIAAENAARNEVVLETFVGPLDQLTPGRFDVVVANILAGVLADMAADLAARVAPAGVLVASGILDDQAEPVKEAFSAAGLKFARQDHDGDWVALRFTA